MLRLDFFDKKAPKTYMLLCWVFCLVLISKSGNSQIKGQLNPISLKRNNPYTVVSFLPNEEFSQGIIYDLIENFDGELVISTNIGVFVFNGYEFKPIISRDFPVEIFLQKLFKYQNVVFGYDSNHQSIIQLYPKLKVIQFKKQEIKSVGVSENGAFAVDINGNVFKLNLNLPDFNTPIGKLPKKAENIYFFKNDIYYTTSAGTFLYDKTQNVHIKISGKVLDAIRINPFSGKIYGFFETKILVFNNQSEEVLIDLKTKTPLKNFNDILFTGDSSFFLTSTYGFYTYNNGNIRKYGFSDGFNTEILYSLCYFKKDEILFIGSSQGLLKLQLKDATTYFVEENLNNTINSIIELDESIYISSYCCDIKILKDSSIVQKINNYFSYSTLANIDGNLYAGVYNQGIKVFRDSKIINEIKSPEIISDQVLAVFKDSRETIWIGTNNGISIKKKEDRIYKNFHSDVIKNHVSNFYEMKDGTICIGTKSGAYLVLTSGEIKKLGPNQGLIAKEVRSFLEDYESKLWIGTYGGGIYCYDKGKLTSLNKKNGSFLNNEAFTLALDGYGQILMSSNSGLWMIPFKALDDFYKNKLDYIIPAHFNNYSGILNTEFNGGFQNNYLKKNHNTFYFPSTQGLVKFQSKKFVPALLYPKINLVGIDSKEIERDNPVIKLKVDVVNFSMSRNVYFQFQINKDGKPEEWSILQKENIFTFVNLAPGKYTFNARVLDASNFEFPAEASIQFVVPHYYYETLWFKILISIILLLFLFVLFMLKIRFNKKRNEEKIRLNNHTFELLLHRLQAQMNPHFVFNCLNTIQALYITGQTRQANEYIIKFSKLLRIVIEHIRQKTVSIREEILMLNLYLSLENIQQDVPFKYNISISPEISPDETNIYGMITYTFVENAIKHGVLPLKDREGEINISFFKENSSVVVEIKDNGDGYKIKEEKKGHISRGIEIFEEKINILNTFENSNLKLEKIDLFTQSNGKEKGTIVRIINIQKDDKGINN
jgi:sensor histidine kinase YesM